MTFFNADGKKYTMPLVSNKEGVFKFGTEDDDLVFVEGTSIADTNVGIDDYVVLSNSRSGNDADKPVTHVLRYVDYDPSTLVLEFESQSDGSTIKVPLSGSGVGYLIPGAHTYKVNVSSTAANEPNISIDLDANNAYGNQVKVIAWGGAIINLAQTVYLNDTTNVTLSNANISNVVGNGKTISGFTGFTAGAGFVQLSAQVLAKKFDTPTTDESFNWTISQSGDEVDLSISSSSYDGPLNTDASDENNGFIMAERDDDDDHTLGLTDYGILMDSFSPDSNPGELTLTIPQSQRYVQMYVSIGEVIHGRASQTTTKVNPLAVGLAALDKDVRDDGENMIVIGGPCINSVAAKLLGSPAQCSEGFVQGSGLIRAFQDDRRIAVLVAGYDPSDTLAASRVLAKYQDYQLRGERMEITTNELGNITVREFQR
jgi:hypothetical protein